LRRNAETKSQCIENNEKSSTSSSTPATACDGTLQSEQDAVEESHGGLGERRRRNARRRRRAGEGEGDLTFTASPFALLPLLACCSSLLAKQKRLRL
jgi:hypothetical protein